MDNSKIILGMDTASQTGRFSHCKPTVWRLDPVTGRAYAIEDALETQALDRAYRKLIEPMNHPDILPVRDSLTLIEPSTDASKSLDGYRQYSSLLSLRSWLASTMVPEKVAEMIGYETEEPIDENLENVEMHTKQLYEKFALSFRRPTLAETKEYFKQFEEMGEYSFYLPRSTCQMGSYVTLDQGLHLIAVFDFEDKSPHDEDTNKVYILSSKNEQEIKQGQHFDYGYFAPNKKHYEWVPRHVLVEVDYWSVTSRVNKLLENYLGPLDKETEAAKRAEIEKDIDENDGKNMREIIGPDFCTPLRRMCNMLSVVHITTSRDRIMGHLFVDRIIFGIEREPKEGQEYEYIDKVAHKLVKAWCGQGIVLGQAKEEWWDVHSVGELVLI